MLPARAVFPLLALLVAATAQAACDRSPLPRATPQAPHRILFVGNSFLYGHIPPVLRYNAARVTDLNGMGYGGVPALFKQLADDAGLSVEVSSELVGGQTLQFHFSSKRALITSRPWDVVVLQEYSTLNPQRPGDATAFIAAAAQLEAAVHGVNPAARVYLLETWARADQVYRTPGGRWHGKSLEAMQADLRAAYVQAMARAACIAAVVPVGDAALRAVQEGVADRNPYDGIDAGKFNLWGEDGYHLGAWGSYLEALVLFGHLSGLDPASLGPASRAGRELGLSAAQIEAAQTIASRQLRSR
ncbi:DUF4886 domain-containing protein [Roseateles sp. NT4]|uniref:DUF4886 domain-containing protein n=1 Tax=Roseateles sp. NT4 TaxID=3453715 RepID=UPI003EED10D2